MKDTSQGPGTVIKGASPQCPTLVPETTISQGSGIWQGHLEAEGQIANVPVIQQEATGQTDMCVYWSRSSKYQLPPNL